MLQESVEHCIFYYDHVKLEPLQLHSDIFIILANNFKNKKHWEIVLTPNDKLPLLPEIVTKNRSLRYNTTTSLLPIVKAIVKLALGLPSNLK